MMPRIYYAKPSITELEVKYATDAARNGWGEHCYDYINKFESLFAAHIGIKNAIATSSCTGALHMGLAALDIKPKDEVILADINWIASAAPITYLGAKPVFIDILSDTWCMDPSKIEAAITSKTKAILAVHLYGNLCEMDEIMEIGKRHNIPVIEDAAEALGSIYKGRRAGSIGDFGVFSFHGTKTITTGEGGMFITNNEELYEKVQTLNSHGRSAKNPKQFWCETIGYKYKMSNIQAAIGCAQMERIYKLIDRKREIFSYYYNSFKELDFIKMNPIPNEEPSCCPELHYAGGDEIVNKITQYGYWMPTIVFDRSIKLNRKKLLEVFKQNNIDARVFFYPLSMMPMFKKVKENIISYDIYNRAINLPSYNDITSSEMERVAKVITDFLNK
jgi:perosamine synthetase